MTLLVIGLVLFLGIHSLPIFSIAARDRLIQSLGRNGWRGVHSLLSLAGLVLIVVGYGQARLAPTVLYLPPLWMRHVTLALMLPVFPLILAAYLPGRIKAKVKHPMLTAIKTWAFAHLLANGMLADELLFGVFLAWAVADRISLKHRSGPSVPRLPHTRANDVIAVLLGLAIYVVFALWLHEWLIGVSPFG